MTTDQSHENLSEIQTDWTDLRLIARPGGAEQAARQAQERLLNRYSGAIRRYVRVAFRDPNNVEDIVQDFAARFLAGGFRHATPDRGRFRDYVKTALFHLVTDHKKKTARLPLSLPESFPEPGVEESPGAEEDERFRAFWRNEMIQRAWQSLEAAEARDGLPLAGVLRYSLDHEGARSAEIAAHFSAETGRAISTEKIRKARMTARDYLQDALLAEVAQTLEFPSLDAVEEELSDLGLHAICLRAIRRRRAR